VYTGPPALRLIRSITFSKEETVTAEMLEVRVDVVRHFNEYPLSGYLPPEVTLPLNKNYEDFEYEIVGEKMSIRKKFPDAQSFTLGSGAIMHDDIRFYLLGRSNKSGQYNENLLLQIFSTFRFIE